MILNIKKNKSLCICLDLTVLLTRLCTTPTLWDRGSSPTVDDALFVDPTPGLGAWSINAHEGDVLVEAPSSEQLVAPGLAAPKLPLALLPESNSKPE